MRNKKKVGAGSGAGSVARSGAGVYIKKVSMRRVIADIGACHDAQVWMNGFPANRAIDYWNNCPEPAWMCWLIWKLTGCIYLRSSNYGTAFYTPLSTRLAERADKIYRAWLWCHGDCGIVNSKRKACAGMRAAVPWAKVERALFELGGGRLPESYKHV